MDRKVRAVSDPLVNLSFDGPSQGTRLARVVPATDPQTVALFVFSPGTLTEQLRGTPAKYFNVPGPGRPLIASVPVPVKPGDPDTSVTLQVSGAAGGPIGLPVLVQRSLK